MRGSRLGGTPPPTQRGDTGVCKKSSPGFWVESAARKSDLENPNMEPDNPKLGAEKFDFGLRSSEIFEMYSKF